MLKIGLIGLGLSVVSALLFAACCSVGLAHFGSCGPDGLGLILILATLTSGGLGALFTASGLLQLGIQKLRSSRRAGHGA
jgi:hypothetical protein